MRRDPNFAAAIPVTSGNVNGSAEMIPAVTGINPAIRLLSVASLGGAGLATFHTGSPSGAIIDSLAVTANGSASQSLGDLEIGLNESLWVVTTTPMNVTVHYVAINDSAGLTKEAARAATYSAYKNAATKAIRRPTRRGLQQEG